MNPRGDKHERGREHTTTKRDILRTRGFLINCHFWGGIIFAPRSIYHYISFSKNIPPERVIAPSRLGALSSVRRVESAPISKDISSLFTQLSLQTFICICFYFMSMNGKDGPLTVLSDEDGALFFPSCAN